MKLLLLALLALQGPAPAPAPRAEEPAKEKKVERPVYDETAVGSEQIAAALGRAKKQEKRVLVQWGANWCGWCKLLDATCKKDKDLAHELLYEYELVKIDVGQFSKHMDLVEKYGANLKDNGIPFLTLLDGDGKVLANQATGELEKADKTTPAYELPKVMAFLKSHEAPQPDATKRWETALATAKSQGKRVFLHFGAPWCHWCHELENWMARPDVAPLLDKGFVDLMIDVDRAKDAAAIQARFPASKGQGIPWFAFLDADGNPLADSMNGDKNVGFPGAPDELTHFASMLEKARTKLSEDDAKALVASLAPKKQ